MFRHGNQTDGPIWSGPASPKPKRSFRLLWAIHTAVHPVPLRLCAAVKVPKNYLNAPGAFAADLAYKSKFFYYTTRSLKSIPLRSRKSHRNPRVICCFYGQTVHYIIFLSRSEPCIFSVLYHKNDIDQKNVKPFSQEIRDVRFFIICDMCSKACIFKLTLLVESANISVASWQSSCKIK